MGLFLTGRFSCEESCSEEEEDGGAVPAAPPLLPPPPLAPRTVLRSLDSTLSEVPVDTLVIVTDPPGAEEEEEEGFPEALSLAPPPPPTPSCLGRTGDIVTFPSFAGSLRPPPPPPAAASTNFSGKGLLSEARTGGGAEGEEDPSLGGPFVDEDGDSSLLDFFPAGAPSDPAAASRFRGGEEEGGADFTASEGFTFDFALLLSLGSQLPALATPPPPLAASLLLLSSTLAFFSMALSGGAAAPLFKKLSNSLLYPLHCCLEEGEGDSPSASLPPPPMTASDSLPPGLGAAGSGGGGGSEEAGSAGDNRYQSYVLLLPTDLL